VSNGETCRNRRGEDVFQVGAMTRLAETLQRAYLVALGAVVDLLVRVALDP
jgi:hypothetical protein